MKKISIVIPCWNEFENVVPMSETVVNILTSQLSSYDYEIIFMDNDSTDGTRGLLRQICARNKRIKSIFNAKNFGDLNSPYYGMLHTTGDCVILMCCDFQDPPELIPEMVKAWEDGNKIIVMQKTQSKENKLMYLLRSCYYKFMRNFSDIEQIEHFTGFGLYDKSFIQVLRDLKDSSPFLRGIVAELGYKIKIIPYTQAKRRAGKSHHNFFSLYNVAMRSFTAYTKMGLRAATFLGFLTSIASMAAGLYYLIAKLIYWDTFNAGVAPLVTGMFFLGAVILIFLGLIGECVISINHRLMNRPLVIEEERINFDSDFNSASKYNLEGSK